MGTLTLQNYRDLVRSRLDDEDYEDTYLDQAINEAQWQITNNKSFSFLEKREVVPIAVSAQSILKPSDYRSIIGMRVVPTDGTQGYDITEAWLDYADFAAMEVDPAFNKAGSPLRWTEFGDSFLFTAPADKAYDIIIDYIRQSPRAVLETDTFDIPDEFQEILKIGAYYRIAKREDDYDVKNQEMVDYAELLAQMERSYSRNSGPRRKRVMRRLGTGFSAGAYPQIGSRTG